MVRRRQSKLLCCGLLAASVITVLFFWILTGLFSHTYDVSYDGEQYQQTAVIALSRQWNPIYESQLPIHGEGEFSRQLVLGSPKIIWAAEASIYQLSHNINSASSFNLIVMLIAAAFIYRALRSIGIGTEPAMVLSLLTVITQLFLEQVFSFRQDAESYEFLLIGIASLIISIRERIKFPYFLSAATVIIFLAGSKFTNLFVFIPFLILLLYLTVKYNWYRLRSLKLSLGVAIIVGGITLASPYITNFVRYHALDFPYNQKNMAQFAKIADTPSNIRHDNRFELFFYGIFSWANLGNSQAGSNAANLKIPLALSSQEIFSDASPSSKVVGGYGAFFSGAMLLSLVSYAILAIKQKTKEDKVVFKWLSLALALIVFASILSPVPNYARFNGQLALFPIAVTVAFILKKANSENIINKFMPIILIGLISLNLLITLAGVTAFESNVFNRLNTQLGSLRTSKSIYKVYASTFYSNYTMLRQAKVNIMVSAYPFNCKKVTYLNYSRDTTQLCKLAVV